MKRISTDTRTPILVAINNWFPTATRIFARMRSPREFVKRSWGLEVDLRGVFVTYFGTKKVQLESVSMLKQLKTGIAQHLFVGRTA